MLDHFIIEFLGVHWKWQAHYFADVRSVGRPWPDINISRYLAFRSLDFRSLAYNDKVGGVLVRSRSSMAVIALGALES